MRGLLGFDRMVTPAIVRGLYFLGLLGVIVLAVAALYQRQYLPAFTVLIFGTIGVRIYSELLIVLFRIHDSLVSINQQMKDRNSSGL